MNTISKIALASLILLFCLILALLLLQGKGHQEFNSITVETMTLPSPAGQIHLSWDITNPDSNYSQIYARVYGPMHTSYPGLDGPLEMKLTGLRGTAILPYTGLPPGFTGYVNLVAEIVGGASNTTWCDQYNFSLHYNPFSGGCDISRILDIIEINTTGGDPDATERYWRQMSPQWRKEITGTSGRVGYSWNKTMGVPVS